MAGEAGEAAAGEEGGEEGGGEEAAARQVEQETARLAAYGLSRGGHWL